MVTEISDLSVLNEMSSIFFLFQISGLQYFSTKELFSKRIHPRYLVYFLLIFASISVTALCDYLNDPPDDENESVKLSVTKSVINLAFYGLFLSAYIITLQSVLTTTANKTIFLNFNKIAETSFNKSFYKIDYKKFKKRFIYKLIIILLGYFLPFVFSQTLKYLEIAPANTTASISYTTLSLLIVKCATLKFVFYADLVNYHLLTIERLLMKPLMHTISVSEILDNFNLNSKNCKPLRTKTENLIKKVSIAKEMYGAVWRNTCLINDCLGWTILMIFTLLTIGLIVLFYLCYVFVIEQADLNMFTGLLYLFVFFTTILTIIPNSAQNCINTVSIKMLNLFIYFKLNLSGLQNFRPYSRTGVRS